MSVFLYPVLLHPPNPQALLEERATFYLNYPCPHFTRGGLNLLQDESNAILIFPYQYIAAWVFGLIPADRRSTAM